MPKKVAISILNASTKDILNTIRANAPEEYRNLIPEVTQEKDLPVVGEYFVGYPAMANTFLSALMNRIAAVKIKSATFNNDYKELKKGYLQFGETVEEVFVSIAKAREFNPDKAEARELQRNIPVVRTAFHLINWKVEYPVTIQQEDLRMAFTNFQGVEDLIAKCVDSVYKAAEYDEYLLFKYLIIKAVAHGKMYPVAFDATDAKNAAKKFRGMSNQLTFMSNKYNEAHVTTNTAKADQFIFMDAQYNAEYDVDVLASAFNMDKATFMGKLKLIDDFTTFDNDRFDVIRANSTMIEEITAEELALMADVKAVLVDGEWFQVYDNANVFTEKFVASGIYWNYFYHTWKTVSSSPFSNAIVFVDDGATLTKPATVTTTVTAKSSNDNVNVLTLTPTEPTAVANGNIEFMQNEDATEEGVAVHKYGAVIMPTTSTAIPMLLNIDGTEYESTDVDGSEDVGDTVTFTKKV